MDITSISDTLIPTGQEKKNSRQTDECRSMLRWVSGRNSIICRIYCPHLFTEESTIHPHLSDLSAAAFPISVRPQHPYLHKNSQFQLYFFTPWFASRQQRIKIAAPSIYARGNIDI